MAIKDSGERTEFSTGAVRDMHKGKGRYDLLPWYAIDEVAKHCEEGALKYGERNVDKGIDQHSLIDSAFRHLRKYWCGEIDEPHLRAAAWNILWALQQETTHPELIDMPNRSADCKNEYTREDEDDALFEDELYRKGHSDGIQFAAKVFGKKVVYDRDKYVSLVLDT